MNQGERSLSFTIINVNIYYDLHLTSIEILNLLLKSFSCSLNYGLQVFDHF